MSRTWYGRNGSALRAFTGVLVLGMAWGGCSAGPVLNEALEQRCNAHCEVDSAACTPSDGDRCSTRCRQKVAGLATACGACVIDHGVPLQEDDDGLGRCLGGTVRHVTVASCAASCSEAEHPGTAADIAHRCDHHCDLAAAPACTEEDRGACVEQCEQLTAGISFGCAICLIDEGMPLQEDDDGLGTCIGSTIAVLSSSRCAVFCDGE